MALKQGKCHLCGNYTGLIFSNNPLVPSACPKCVAAQINVKNLEQVDFFCRTYNIPFEPNEWMKALKTAPTKTIETYIDNFLNSHTENLYYTTSTKDIWKEANKEWEKTLTHTQLLDRISAIKDSFLDRGRIKWGMNFSFEELIQLENLFSATVSAFDVNNPMQIDAIKKACKASVMVDKAMLEGMNNGDVKSIKDLTSAYQGFMKMAKIDEMIESSQTEVLRTVADLAKYLEDKGFEFTFYDNYDRDIVDKTIRDMKDHLRTVVLESTGLEPTLEMIRKNYEAGQKEKENFKNAEPIALEEIIAKAKSEFNEEVDSALQAQDILEEDLIYDQEEFG